jgi:hypothetical protein
VVKFPNKQAALAESFIKKSIILFALAQIRLKPIGNIIFGLLYLAKAEAYCQFSPLAEASGNLLKANVNTT